MVLLLAGTREARALAGLLVDEPGVDVEASLAGQTEAPVGFPCALRIGGFGGVGGLVDHLVTSAVDVLVDATHPFAATMPWHAAAAADRVGVPRLRLLRPAWQPQPGDRWLPADNLADAARQLRQLGARRVFVTTGRLDLAQLLGLVGVHLVVRAIEAPARVVQPRGLPASPGPAEVTVIRGRGPFSLDGERALLRDHAIDALVTKNAGGDDAKLVAARELGVPVVMVGRPPPVPGPAVSTPSAALAWLRTSQPAPEGRSQPGDAASRPVVVAADDRPRRAPNGQLAMIPPPGEHGGDGARVAAALEVSPDEVLDLSASVNPFAPDVVGMAARHLGALRRYPDVEAAEAVAAELVGVDASRLVLTAGAAQAIALVANHLAVGRVDEPEFSLYRRHLERIESSAPRWRSDPHSPSGRLAGHDERAHVWDEAFLPLSAGVWTRHRPGWAVGSLTKAFACPGLRLGYAVAPDEAAAAALRHDRPAWAVDGHACAVLPDLAAAADPPGWTRRIAAARAELVTTLHAHGLRPEPSEALWVLVPGTPGLRDHLARQAVVVRDCTSFGLPDHTRIAVPDASGLERLDAALRAARRSWSPP